MESQRQSKPPQSAYLIDLLFLLLAPQHPALVVLALLQYGVRRSSALTWQYLRWLRVRQILPWHCILFPGAAVYLMSNEEQGEGPDQAVAEQLPATSQEAGQLIAKPGNGVKSVLPGNDVAGALGNGLEEGGDVSEYRKILHQQGALLALARLINAGKVGQTDAIVIGMEVKASGRADSTYAQLRAQLLPLIKQPDKFPPLTPEQEQARKILEGV